jgi:DNA polymerase III epsilon subunit-like protein
MANELQQFDEAFISVDIETAGPIPAKYSMLSLGACLVENPAVNFYAELKPVNKNSDPKALEVSGFSLETLEKSGEEPRDALTRFSEWVRTASKGRPAVFVGFNAAFDWSIVNWYFHTYIGENPFGFAPLDIKAYFMGLSGCSWSETKSSRLPPEYQIRPQKAHNALSDAQAQGAAFIKMLHARRG